MILLLLDNLGRLVARVCGIIEVVIVRVHLIQSWGLGVGGLKLMKSLHIKAKALGLQKSTQKAQMGGLSTPNNVMDTYQMGMYRHVLIIV